MKIEIVVVKTEIDLNGTPSQIKQLRLSQNDLLKLYGGLTVIPSTKGLWMDKDGLVSADSSEIWQIYVRNDFPNPNADIMTQIPEGWALLKILKAIQTATSQRSQFFAVNNEGFLLDAEGVKSV